MKKKVLSLLSIAAFGSLILASCNTIEARPTESVENAPILDLDDITNNTMGEIYDALVTPGDTNSQRVLDNVLYIYSQSIYGSFFDTTLEDGAVVPGLRTVAESYINDGTSEPIQAFADLYPIYHDDEGHGSIDKVLMIYEDILYRVREVFLGYVNDATYQVRSQFSEKKFYDAQIASYHDLAQVENGVYPYNEGYTQLQGSFRLSEGIEETGSTILDGGDLSHPGDIENAYFKDIFGTYQNYIEAEVLPDIYRNELTAQYLYSQNYGQVRLTSARKVDYIALPTNSENMTAVQNLASAYSHQVIEAGLDMDVYGFPFLDSIYKGTVEHFTAEQTELATSILGEAEWTAATINVNGTDVDYYAESSYGTILAQYARLTDNRFDDDTAIRDDFTGDGAYTVETGLAIKEQALIAQDNTNNGWFTSSNIDIGVASITDRLFRVQVANEVDSTPFVDGKYQNDTPSDHFQYGTYRGGNYYLTPASYETGDSYPYIIYNGDNTTTYIVKVDEAVKAAKLTEPSSTASESAREVYYDNMPKHADEPYYAEKVARKVAYSLATGDTWTTAANRYYVNQMAIVYHDSYIYDYFRTTFPDLFD